MVGQGDVLHHLVELVALEGGQGVLLAVNGAGLQGHVQLVDVHGGSGSAPGLYHLDVQVALRNTDLHALQVSQSGDGLVGGQLTGAVVEGAHDADVHLLEQLIQGVLVFAVQSLLHVLHALPQVGSLYLSGLGDPGSELGRALGDDVHHALLNALHQVGGAAQHTVGIAGHMDALGVGVDLVDGLHHHLGNHLGLGMDGAPLEFLHVFLGFRSGSLGGGGGIGSGGCRRGGGGRGAAAGAQGNGGAQGKNQSQ